MGIFNKIKDEAKNKATNKIKKMAMNIIKVFLIKAAIILLISVTSIVLLSSFWYILKKDTVTQTSSTIRNEDGTPAVSINDNKRQYVLDEEFEKRVQKVLNKLEINANSVGLTEELITNMYIAEVITLFPDLRTRDKIGTEVSKGEIQGCIQFRRNYSDGTQELLEYMEFDEFRTELAKFGYDLQDAEGNSIVTDEVYITKEQVDTNYEKIKKYFTLDEEYNVIIASLSSNEVTTTYSEYAKEEGQQDGYDYQYYIDIKKLNYQTAVGKYAMPLEFTLAILTISENPAFCEAILGLVEDSKIVIEVQDNLTTTNIVEKYDYAADFSLEKKIEYYVMESKPTQDSSGNTNSNNNNKDESVKVPFEEETVPVTSRASRLVAKKDDNFVEWGPGEGEGNSGTSTETPKEPEEEPEEQPENPSESEDTTPPESQLEKVEYSSNPTGTYKKDKDMDNPYREVQTNIQNMDINLCITEANTWLMEATVYYDRTVEPTTDSYSTDIEDDIDYVEVTDYHKLLEDLSDELPEDATETSREESVKEKQSDKEQKVESDITSITYNKISTNICEKEEKFLSLLSVDPKTKVFNKEDISRNTKLIKYEDIYGKDTSPESNLLISKQILFEFLALNERTQPLEETMRYLLYIYTGKSNGVTSLDFSIYDPSYFTSISGGISGITGIQGQIYDFLLSKGMSSVGAAAILGNMQKESSFVVNNTNGTHYGLCQWGDDRFESLKEEANKVGKTWENLEVQLNFLWLELETTYTSTKDELMNATDLYSAVDYFTRNYEVCGDYDSEVEIRYQYAQNWYNLALKNNQVINHSGVTDIQLYNLNVHEGFIEYKQLDYTQIPPSYQATSSPAGTIKDKGCMPTSISIILSGMGVKDSWGIAYTPETLISTRTIAHINGGSSTAANARNTFAKCGLNSSPQKSTKTAQATSDILANLNAGNPILIHASTGYYTSEGHLMTLIDVEGDQVYLSNPGSRNKTGWVSLSTLISRNVDWYMVVSR